MCWCDPNKRTPWCGKPGCRPEPMQVPSAAKPEPAPVRNANPAIQDLVIADLRASVLWPSQHVADDLEARKAMGRAKYGTLLQAFNGRNALVDAYQESLDLVVYLRQAKEEGRDEGGTYGQALHICRLLRRLQPK